MRHSLTKPRYAFMLSPQNGKTTVIWRDNFFECKREWVLINEKRRKHIKKVLAGVTMTMVYSQNTGFCRYLHIHISIVLIERLVPCDEWRLVLLKWKWRNFCLRIGMGKHSYWSVTMQKWMSLNMHVFIRKWVSQLQSVTVSLWQWRTH